MKAGVCEALLPAATDSVSAAGLDFGGTNGGLAGAGGTGKSTSDDFGLVDTGLEAGGLAGAAALGVGVSTLAGAGASVLAGLLGLGSAVDFEGLASALVAESVFTGRVGLLDGFAVIAFFWGGDFFGGVDFFKGGDFFGDGDVFATTAFFAALTSGFLTAGAGFEGLTAGFACPFGGAVLGLVFFAAMTLS